MELTGIWSGLYKVSVLVTRLAWLNILWLISTLIGLILFGIMPATIAMFTVVRKWIQKDYDVNVFSTFVKAYKENFIRSNLFGIIIYVLGYVLSIFLKYTGYMNESELYPVLFGIFILASFFYVMLILYIAPVYVHFDLTFWQYIRYAVTIGAVNLHYSICTLTLLAGIYFLSFRYPGFGLFFGFSLSAYIIMFLANIGFKQLVKKQQEQTGQQAETVST
ncbi:YesL family protein [Gracilibacillus oryzae]|uniref:YesL family protein n=1 Tax=Gracilibacillus oryzae TaxID=1672701 RepID=A0A7C8GTI2_9BACI|nr:YesL family protein [Gracilibacillus oryzae]KAB8137599.1 YesL family protein [Gracilibacillus oryzae]